MYQQLYQYFLLRKKLSLAGIGTFVLERKPADIDIANRLILPPAYTIALHHGGAMPEDELIEHLAARRDISQQEAAEELQRFLEQTKAELAAGRPVFWKGMGTLTKGLTGEVRFEALQLNTAASAVPAIRVLRENAEHKVRVGEDERTSEQMREMLQPTAGKRSVWWAIALIIALAAFVFVCYYFSQHGISAAATGNQRTVTPTIISPSTSR